VNREPVLALGIDFEFQNLAGPYAADLTYGFGYGEAVFWIDEDTDARDSSIVFGSNDAMTLTQSLSHIIGLVYCGGLLTVSALRRTGVLSVFEVVF